MTDWSNPLDKVTPHFTVGDALMLHAWGRLAAPGPDGVDTTLIQELCLKMEEIRTALGCPIFVHCMFRSVAYNQAQNIQPAADVHSMSLACDFDAGGILSIDEIKAKLEPLLPQLGIRMERGTPTWVHIDLHSVGLSGRYFTA